MVCSPRIARTQLDLYIELARQADHNDFIHTVRVGGLSLSIHTGAAGAEYPLFTRGPDRIISMRVALQIVETYGTENR